MTDPRLLELTADIVSAHLSNNTVTAGDVPTLIRNVFDALTTATQAPEPDAAKPVPAVSIRASVKPDHIVCLEDGKKLKMLKRYLRTNFAMSPEEYRTKWNLPRDYPMVAPDYAERRRGLAIAIGLGRKAVTKEAAAVVSASKRVSRKAAAPVEAAGDVLSVPIVEATKAGRRKLGIVAAKAAAIARLGREAAAKPTPAPAAAPTSRAPRKPRASKGVAAES